MNKDKLKELIQTALQNEETSTIDTGFSGRADYGEEDKALGSEDELEMKGLEEALNPEVTKAVSRFIKAMAKRYSYSEKDAVFAIQAALKQRNFDGLDERVAKIDEILDERITYDDVLDLSLFFKSLKLFFIFPRSLATGLGNGFLFLPSNSLSSANSPTSVLSSAVLADTSEP
jgi:hypothetical protein